jgi:hypothetical protein
MVLDKTAKKCCWAILSKKALGKQVKLDVANMRDCLI